MSLGSYYGLEVDRGSVLLNYSEDEETKDLKRQSCSNVRLSGDTSTFVLLTMCLLCLKCTSPYSACASTRIHRCSPQVLLTTAVWKLKRTARFSCYLEGDQVSRKQVMESLCLRPRRESVIESVGFRA